jgi:hypothetical protein
MRLILIIAVGVWIGIWLSRRTAEDFYNVFAGMFRDLWWLIRAPFRLGWWILLELFGNEAQSRRLSERQAKLLAEASRREANRRTFNTIGALYAILCLVIALVGLAQAILPLMGKWAVTLPLSLPLWLVASILLWNRRWKRLHGPPKDIPISTTHQ